MTNEGFLEKLRRKYGKYAINNLTFYMTILYVVGYVLYLITGGYSDSLLQLDMNSVMHGQVWRLFTFLMIPPDKSILVIITIFFYWSIGTSLERTWGAFYYNVYMIGGVVLTWIGTFLGWVIMYAVTGQSCPIVGTNYYLLMSMFLAFAFLFPDMQVLFMFIIPIKVKWMAYFYYAIMAYQIFNYLLIVRAGYVAYLGYVVSIVMSLLNFFIFYYMTKKRSRVSRKQRQRKREFQANYTRVTPQGITRHKCAICGATEESNPDYEFRFCSKCNGNYEYCQNHLFTHEHIK